LDARYAPRTESSVRVHADMDSSGARFAYEVGYDPQGLGAGPVFGRADGHRLDGIGDEVGERLDGGLVRSGWEWVDITQTACTATPWSRSA